MRIDPEPAAIAEAVAERVAREVPGFSFAVTQRLRLIVTAEVSRAQRYAALGDRVVQPVFRARTLVRPLLSCACDASTF